MVLLGVGAGIAFNPMLLAAMSDVEPNQSGLASGVMNTSFMMGGSLGLAVLASLASARTQSVLASGASASTTQAMHEGFSLAFLIGGSCAAVAALVGVAFIRTRHGGAPVAQAATH
jgi:hypothetical protein